MKQYYFLIGIPRTGNTLLSSILNQNPDLKVSAYSFLDDHLYQTALQSCGDKYQNFPDEKSLKNLMRSVFDSYYKDWDAKYIIDRGNWGTPTNLDLLQQVIDNDIKIICTVRDIVEIIASFLKISPDRWIKELKEEIESGLRYNQSYKSELELLCEVIMRPKGQVETALYGLNNLFCNHRDLLHIVEYNDLVDDTEETIKGIYNFLEIDYYPHKFHYINQFEINGVKYDDSIWGADLHKVGKKIKHSNYKVEDILTPELIQKYSNMEFWR